VHDDRAGPDGRADTAGFGRARGLEPAAGRVPVHAGTRLESASGVDPCAHPAKDSEADAEADTEANARASAVANARAASRMQAD
jgi:hypothetical protein